MQYIMKSLELKVASSSLKLCIVVFFMSLFNFGIVILTLLATLRFRIIIKRKIIRNKQGYVAELDEMSLKDSDNGEQQEIEMRILNSQERHRDEQNKNNSREHSRYENVNNYNDNNNQDVSQNPNNLYDVVVRRKVAY